MLIEANRNLPTRPGTTPIKNMHGLVLALLDSTTGDVALRGNLITNRTITR
jgi:hypothetical protein